jgi:NAD-dependent SIR2 family protein deacetylase
VYGDVSKLEFFERTKLDYRDVCDPSLLIKNPERYFGWAALNITKYRAARPHAGYDLLRRWRDDIYPSSREAAGDADKVVRELHARLRDPTSIRSLEGLGVTALPGRTFVFTTNVDGFFLRAGFKPEEVTSSPDSI